MMRRRLWIARALVLAVLAMLSASGSVVGQSRGGAVRFLLIVDAETGIDPHKRLTASSEVMLEQMYETLVDFDASSGDFKPALAESWQVSQDGKVYTFRIRRAIRFHNGRELTAADVKYSFDRILDPATASPRRLAFSPIERIDAPDPRTVIFTLKTLSAPFLANLVHIGSAIVPREAVEQHGDLAKSAAGTGPFLLKEWVRDGSMRLERNPNYWRAGQPYLDGLEFRFNADPNARTAAFRSGQVNFLYKVDKPFVRTLRLSDQNQVVGGPSPSYGYLLMNVNRPPFSDVRVRQAINWAMDRDVIRQNTILGFGLSLRSGPLPPEHWAGLKEPIFARQDVNRARELLQQAGFTGGRFNITVVSIGPNVRAAETLQQQLRPLGFDIEVRVLEPAPMLRAAFSADFDMLMLRHNFGIDPDDHLSQAFLTGGGANWVKFSDPELDALISRARVAGSRADRTRIYRDVMRRLALQGPMAFVYLEADYHAFPNALRGFRFDPTSSFRWMREVWWDR
ncbi:MAG: ABC transporter substrate-binding protein [Armatimonadota bacterium]